MDAILDVLKKGMSTELWGMRFYEEAVARTESADGKKVFQSLVDEESGHLAILRGEYANVSDAKDFVSVDEAVAMAESADFQSVFPEPESAGQLIPASATDAEALKMAMDFEQSGYRMYTDAAQAAGSEGERKMWQFLAKAEDAHYAFLQESYDYLVNNGVWYFDDQEKPFFEG